MARIIRTLALTGAATAALLGAAGTVHADTPEQTHTAIEAAVDRVAGAPVTLPSGRTLHVRGLDTAAYRTDAAHHQAVTVLADSGGTDLNPGQGAPIGRDTGIPGGAGIGTGVTSQQQIQTQAGAGSISVTVALGIALAVVTFLLVKKGHVKPVYAIALVMFGVFLAPTTFGPMLSNLGVSLGTSLGNVWAGF